MPSHAVSCGYKIMMYMDAKRIIITGAGAPAGVNFINSLRDSPEKFYLIGTDLDARHLLWADVDEGFVTPKNTDSDYIDKTNSLIDKTGAQLIHPQPDSEVLTLAKNRKKLHCMTFLPSTRTVEICQDKFESARIWEKSGIHTSESVLVKNTEDIDKAIGKIGFPFWLRATHGASSRGSTPVNNKKTAIAWIDYWRSRGTDWDFVAQEYLPGRNIAFQSVWNEGEIVTSQARERLEYLYPNLAPSGVTNTPTISKTIHDDTINEIATKCVKAIDKNATGVFCVDMKGRPIPTEINTGRFFTTSYFFTRAGINMPYYYVKLAFGERLPKLKKYNAVQEGLLWVRHIDCPAVLVRESDVKWNRI
jgi:biotin carboxylase